MRMSSVRDLTVRDWYLTVRDWFGRCRYPRLVYVRDCDTYRIESDCLPASRADLVLDHFDDLEHFCRVLGVTPDDFYLDVKVILEDHYI